MEDLLNSFQLIKYIKENPNISFVSVATTPWHLIGLEYCLENCVSDYEHGLVLIAKHEISGFCLDIMDVKKHLKKNIICCKFTNIGENRSDLIFGGIKLFLSNKYDRKIKIISPEKPWIRFALSLRNKVKIGFKFIVFDEGIGAYYRKSRFYYNGIEKLKFLIIRKIERDIVRKHDFVDNSLFIMKNEHLLRNQNIINEYKRKFESQQKIHPLKDNGSEQYVIINTQTYHDNGEISNNEDVFVLKEITKILTSRGFKVYLKPHPRDKSIQRYQDLKLQFIDKNISQEAFIASLDRLPTYVIGFTTTTLITLLLFFNIKPISLVGCIKDDFVLGNAKKDFKLFRKLFGNMVFVPHSLNEFEDVL